MRIVTNTQFDRLLEVMARVRVELRAGAEASAAANAELADLIKAGRLLAPLRLGRKIIKTDTALQARLADEVESAAVRFFGERRLRREALSDYLARLDGLCVDFSVMLATQRANGLEYRP